MKNNTQISCCVFIQENQELLIESLNELNNVFEKRDNDLKNLVNTFAIENKENTSITGLVYIHNLLKYIGQIEFNFSELQKIKEIKGLGNFEECALLIQEKRNFVEGFFHNASLFMKLVKNYTKIEQNLQFKKLAEDITEIRDHFEHADFKDRGVVSGLKAIVSFEDNLGFNLDYLKLINIENNESIGILYFSIPAFYFSLRDIFNEIKNNPEILIK